MKAIIIFVLFGAFEIWAMRHAMTPPPGHDWAQAYGDAVAVDLLVTAVICGTRIRRAP